MLAEVRLLRRIAITVVGAVILAVGVVLIFANLLPLSGAGTGVGGAVGGLTVLLTMAYGGPGSAECQEG